MIDDDLPPNAFAKQDEADDLTFYAPPRLVKHIDDFAVAALTDFYHDMLPEGARVLDLMSSWVSHLPNDRHYAEVVGHGMNAEELAANPRLDRSFVQDFNLEPSLPLADRTFDAALCCVGVPRPSPISDRRPCPTSTAPIPWRNFENFQFANGTFTQAQLLTPQNSAPVLSAIAPPAPIAEAANASAQAVTCVWHLDGHRPRRRQHTDSAFGRSSNGYLERSGRAEPLQRADILFAGIRRALVRPGRSPRPVAANPSPGPLRPSPPAWISSASATT